MAQNNTPSRWVGWVYFAGAMLLVTGGLQMISGLVAIFRHTFYVVNSAQLDAFNYTTWGWISLIIGFFIMLAGIGVWAGSTFARLVAIFLAIFALLDSIAFMNAYPLWGLIGVIVSALSIYALTMHGSEVKD